MLREKVYMVQKVFIEYRTPKERKEAIRRLKDNPNCLSMGGSYVGFRKSKGKPIVTKEIIYNELK